MLHRVFSAHSLEKTRFFHQSILENVKNDQKVLYIVPEQNTVFEEAAVANLLEELPPFLCEVTNFSRLCNLVFRKYGSLSFRPITKTGKLLLLSKALKGLNTPILNVRFDRPAAVERLLAQIEELSDFGIKPDDLEKLILIAKKSENERLEKKLDELCSVYRLYLQLLDKGFDHQAGETKRMLKILDKEDFFGDYIIYIDGFYDFTADQYAVMRRMALGAKELFVGIFAEKKDLTQESFAIRALNAAKKLALMCDPDSLKDHFLPCKASSEELEYVANNLLSPSEPKNQPPKDIKILRCPTAQEEVIFAARTIRELVYKGAKYSSISVSFRNDGIYPTLCERIFPRYGIPLHSSVKKDPSKDPLIRSVELACRIACGDRRLKQFRKYLKTNLCGLTADESFALESYALTWDLNHSAWYKPLVMPPKGYGSKFDEEQRNTLSDLEKIRQKLLAPLLNLEQGLKNSTAREKLLSVTNWLREIKAYESITSAAELLREKVDFSQADQKLNLWNDLVKALSQIDLTLGDVEMDNDEFCDVLKLALKSCSIGTLPPAPDCVQVGEASFMRSGETEILIVLGLNSGVFPAEDQQTAILTPLERNFFKDNNMELSLDGAQNALNEYFIFERLLRTPSKGIILSYRDRKSSASGSAQTASVFISNIKALFPALEEEKFDSSSSIPTCKDEALLYFCSNYNKKNALTDQLYQKLGNSALIDKLERASDFIDSKQELTSSPYSSLAMTQSRIERFNNCRYSYFAEYMLKLSQKSSAFFDHADNGTIVHALLERFFSEMYSNGLSPESIDFEEVKPRALELCKEFIDQWGFRDFSDKNKVSYLIEQTAESLSYAIINILKELSQSEFVPVLFEVDMPKDAKPYRIPLPDGSELSLFGRIDRVDLYKAKDGTDYLRVIDYKSNSKEFLIQDVYNGLSQQMLIYLFALCNQKLKLKNIHEIEPQPAGIMYVTAAKPKISASDDMTAEQIKQKAEKTMARSGLVLDDPEIIDATDSQKVGLILPKGNPTKFLAKMEEFALLEKHTQKQLTKLACELKKGIISPNPFKNHHNSCEYCRFAAVCKMQSRPTRPYVLFDRIEDVYQQMKEEQK